MYLRSPGGQEAELLLHDLQFDYSPVMQKGKDAELLLLKIQIKVPFEANSLFEASSVS
jgi:hypothetical protein